MNNVEKSILELSSYLEKKGKLNYVARLDLIVSNYKNNKDSILKLGRTSYSTSKVPTQNQIAIDIARENGAYKSIGDSSINFGSDVEFRPVPGDIVANGVKEDTLKDGRVIVRFPDSRSVKGLSSFDKYRLLNVATRGTWSAKESAYSSDERALQSQRVIAINFAKKYLSENRSRNYYGGASKFLTWAFGGVSGAVSDSTLTSQVDDIYILPANLGAVVIENFDIGSVSWNEVIDLITDLVSIGALLGTAIVSGGATVSVNAIRAFKAVGNVSTAVGILNNIIGKQWIEAAVGIICLGLGVKKSKKLGKFYAKFFAKRGDLIPIMPSYFLDLVEAVLSIGQYVLEQVVGKIDEYIISLIDEYFGGAISEEEMHAKLMQMENSGSPKEKYIGALISASNPRVQNGRVVSGIDPRGGNALAKTMGASISSLKKAM